MVTTAYLDESYAESLGKIVHRLNRDHSISIYEIENEGELAEWQVAAAIRVSRRSPPPGCRLSALWVEELENPYPA